LASIYHLKSRFQVLLRPLASRLASAGVTANQVTVAALAVSAAAGAAVLAWPDSRWPLLLLPPVLLLRMALNAIDGMLAREHAMASRLGLLLNELGDVLSDSALYLPLALVPGLSPVPLVLAVVLAVVGEMTGVLAQQLGAARRYDGPMGKSDRAVALGGLALVLGLGVPPGLWSALLLWAVVALLLVTIWNRARRALAAGPP
jgi:CDP-diacylglycerol--glycerol-3-phosphate 3-phosphatidyltransferase